MKAALIEAEPPSLPGLHCPSFLLKHTFFLIRPNLQKKKKEEEKKERKKIEEDFDLSFYFISKQEMEK